LTVAALCPAAAQHPTRWAKVTSCPAADSLIGPLRGDWAARVHGFHDAAGDSTMLWSGTPFIYEGDEWWVNLLVRHRGVVPTGALRPALLVAFRSRPWAARLGTDPPPHIALVLDDSIQIAFAPPLRGQYYGEGDPVIPLSVNLTELQFVGLVRARRVRLLVGPVILALSADDRRDLRGLFRLAWCGQPVGFGAAVTAP
jgi:hypothetical protein